MLGEFRPNDRLLLINQSGKLKTSIPELPTHSDKDIGPMSEIIYVKVKGVQKDNQTINLEEFIAVKGIKASENQLTADKLK